MADSGHYYRVYSDGSIEPMHDLSLAQARRAGCYASVTTKIGVLKNSFLDQWRMKNLVLTASSTPRLPKEEDEDYVNRIDAILWGQPTRWDGVKLQSSDFGLAVHSELEQWNQNSGYEVAPEWELYTRGWKQWFADHVSRTIAAEYMAVDHDLRTVGTVDFIGMKKDETAFLADYKTRQCAPKNVGKFYFKDCMQLAIEADIIRRERGLDYMPECWSMCICADSGNLYAKKWTEKMVNRGIEHFKALSNAYDIVNQFTGQPEE